MRILNVRGGTSFWQWDTGRKIVIIGDEDICGEAHFCTGSGDPFPVTIRTEDGRRVADVPDEVLQEAKPFSVYLYHRDGSGGATRCSKRFAVHPRTKPADYVYTPSERQTWSQLLARIEDLEGEGLAKAVADYLTENPIEAGATVEQAQQIKQNQTNIARLTNVKLDSDKLPEAVNDALAQAKASGEFDGKDGQNGRDGVDGKDGEPGPAGADGKDGSPGKDGVDGKPGKDGQDGKTPVKFVDYFTPDEIEDVARQAAGMVEVPEGGGGESSWETIFSGNIPENVNMIRFDFNTDESGNEFTVDEVSISGTFRLATATKVRIEINGLWLAETYDTTDALGAWGHSIGLHLIPALHVCHFAYDRNIITRYWSGAINSIELHCENAEVVFSTESTRLTVRVKRTRK